MNEINSIADSDFNYHRNQADFAFKKTQFLKTLGANDENSLYQETLVNGFLGDNFKNNNFNIFRNFCNQKKIPDSNNFFNDFISWSKEKIYEAFKNRFKIVIFNIFGLFAAFAISFFAILPAIVFAIMVGISCGILEGVAKRNVANIGHLQTHLGNKIQQATHNLIDKISKSDFLSDNAKSELKNIKHPLSNNPQSALTRGLSYFSGMVVGLVYNLSTRFLATPENISPIIFKLIEAFIPFMSLVSYLFSKKSAQLRQQTAKNRCEYLNSLCDIIYEKKSWNEDVSDMQINGELSKLSKSFNDHIKSSDISGRLQDDPKFKKNENSDSPTNPSKVITFVPWLSANFNRIIKEKIFKIDAHDLARSQISTLQISRRSHELDKRKLDQFPYETKSISIASPSRTESSNTLYQFSLADSQQITNFLSSKSEISFELSESEISGDLSEKESRSESNIESPGNKDDKRKLESLDDSKEPSQIVFSTKVTKMSESKQSVIDER